MIREKERECVADGGVVWCESVVGALYGQGSLHMNKMIDSRFKHMPGLWHF